MKNSHTPLLTKGGYNVGALYQFKGMNESREDQLQ